MKSIINKSITITELYNAVKTCYPNSSALVDGPWVVLDVNDKVKYTIWLKKPNFFEVFPATAIWFRTFEMKAKATDISNTIKLFIENGLSSNNSNIVVPETCPHCRNPNSKKIRLCEWCGNQII